ncbi:Hypothetical protein NTJ_02755 [Nesidiocoris tenuis]|uniref:Uncharacterized protein n=1 Tax=Nesidiocoris tenuis TaxID=355587 RepID=A0ABN7ACC5_9HEMI|nr:Hypothetical protein NTJ_02755 [Nesidiocoris tenuis]
MCKRAALPAYPGSCIPGYLTVCAGRTVAIALLSGRLPRHNSPRRPRIPAPTLGSVSASVLVRMRKWACKRACNRQRRRPSVRLSVTIRRARPFLLRLLFGRGHMWEPVSSHRRPVRGGRDRDRGGAPPPSPDRSAGQLSSNVPPPALFIP